MKINKFFAFAVLFFFLNTAGLPHGLLYTTLLTPFLYIWVVRRIRFEPVLPFLLILSPYFIIHLINGVKPTDYFVSLGNIICIYILCWAIWLFFRSGADVEKIFNRLLYINFVLCLIAIPFYFTAYSDIFWIEQQLTQGVNNFKRLKMFTYEASYYSTLLVPLFFFYVSQIMLGINRINKLLLAVLLAVPFLLSFSLGVISGILIASFGVWFLYLRNLTRKRNVFLLLTGGCFLLILGIFILFNFFPENTLFVRLANISSGHDSSTKGRTFEAFMLADRINALRSQVFGIGWGQIKVIGTNIIRSYYNYPPDYVITIPNVTAETLTILGWSGLLLRLLLEVVLFIQTRVWTNYYRLFLFLFIFVYQFTGSFITSTAEYLIWILAFTNAFPQFDVISRPKSITKQD